MRALTVRQPYADWLLHDRHPGDIGRKDVENRSWLTPYRGPLLIHAGARLHDQYTGFEPDYPLVFSAILGVVDLVDVHHSSDCHDAHTPIGCSHWAFSGDYHWVTANPRPFEKPVPCGGALQVWSLDRLDDLTWDLVQDQLEAVGA